MSYNIAYEQYVSMLESDNEDVIKGVLQEIFELLVTNKRMLKSKRASFMKFVEKHVNSKSQKVRKWAYHCACFYQNDVIRQSIIWQLKSERNAENIIWALTALSVEIYDDISKLQQCVGRRHDEFIETISENYLNDALILFGNHINIEPNKILLKNNSADLLALTKVYAYHGIICNDYPDVTDSIIREMLTNEDSNVREYAYWSQVLGESKGDFLNISADPVVGVRKWQIANQIQNGDTDFVVDTLKLLILSPQKIPFDIKSGILRGLSKISYNNVYVPYINSWFERESDESINFLLIDYIIKNCYINQDDGTYFDVVKDSLNDPLLVAHIVSKIENNPQYNLAIQLCGDNYFLDFKTEDKTVEKALKRLQNDIECANVHKNIIYLNMNIENNDGIINTGNFADILNVR